MAQSVIGTIGTLKAETAEQFVQQYVDWIRSQPHLSQGGGQPAAVGFMLTQSNPASYGAQLASSPAEVIFSWGNLYYSGGNTLAGSGTLQSSKNHFGQTDTVYVSIDTNGVLTVSGALIMTTTLHHDVLVGSTPMPVESTSPGSVATLMLWMIPAVPLA
jgi:hypothetical protein